MPGNPVPATGVGTAALMETSSRKTPPFAPPSVSLNANTADVPLAVNVMANGVQSKFEMVEVPWLIDWLSRVFAPLVTVTSADTGTGTPGPGLFA